MNGKAILKTLKEIEGGEYYSVWNLLPEVASGKEWIGEIKDACQAVADYIEEDEDYELEDLRDYGHEYADNCASSSYKYIHDQVHALNLWASDEIESQVDEYYGDTRQDLKKLEQLYYYVAMRMTFDAVADQAFENSEELEEASA